MWNIEEGLPIQIAVIEIENTSVGNDKQAYRHLKECALNYKAKYENSLIGDVPRVEFARRLFLDIGLDPTKHRPASEALLRRALKELEFYTINNLVDVGNWCALDFLLPTCVYDADKIKGIVTVRRGKSEEAYTGLNNRMVNLDGRFVIADELGAFGSPMTDSERTAVDFLTKRAILLIYTPRNYDKGLLSEQAKLFAKRSEEFCRGKLKNIQILSG